MSTTGVQHGTSNLLPNVDQAFANALAHSLSADSFTDVAFYAYSKRSPTGRVHGMQRILANSTVLKASSTYFRGLLSCGFTESEHKESLASGLFYTSYTDSYDYESDSDLEEDGGLDEPMKLSTPSAPTSVTLEAAGTTGVEATASAIPLNLFKILDSAMPGFATRLRVVPMRSVAANTLKSLIYYVYTGKVFFLPLTSCGVRSREKALAEHIHNHQDIPICSSKSLYRIADEMGHEDLKQISENHIRTQLGQENILDEILSQFSSKHPAVLDMQIRILRTNDWQELTSFETAFREKMDSIVKGDVPHASAALVSLVCTTRRPPEASRASMSPPMSRSSSRMLPFTDGWDDQSP